MLHRRIELICAPTPLHPLPRISKDLGIDLWIKRDDLTGLAAGGNKGRKLEYLLADIIESGADTVVTSGAYQSNFVRQCAAVCSMYGIAFHAAVMHWPHPDAERATRPEGWQAPQRMSGNRYLDDLVAANIQLVPDGTWDELDDARNHLAESLSSSGRNVYNMPGGGSSGIGALGYVRAANELFEQDANFDTIIVASGSGSTQTGLVHALAAAGSKTGVIGICTDREPEMVNEFAKISTELDELLLTHLKLAPADFDLRTEYAGKGYQAPSEGAAAAIEYVAKIEGIFLDPVYTGKAFAGLLDLARKNELRGRTLFWHTGGLPTLLA